MAASTITTTPYEGQKPGTSGLRKKVTVYQQPNYLANFVQSLFSAIPESEYKDQTLICSGDGRYWNREAIQIIAGIACANGVKRLWIGQHGWLSTPAASCVIRCREGGVCRGGFILTASHNPGGPDEDFGIKYNCNNGEPALESITNAIYEKTKTIQEIQSVDLPNIDLETLGVQQLTPHFCVEIINPTEDWVALMKSIFDFDMIKNLIKNQQFKFVYDGMHGIGGPYAHKIFVNELGASETCLMRCNPLPDFGGLHPDPNLKWGKQLVDLTKGDSSTALDFAAAGDGDCDRNMILGNNWFVTPSDSVAIIASYAQRCIPYFKDRLAGVARSMPTSMALASWAAKEGITAYEVPTGWKFFGNLMDAGMCSICGEESFGTGSDHIREKDGIWAVLCWLSILAYRFKTDGKIVSVQQINEEFWKSYGRNYYMRYDYEGVDSNAADNIMQYVANDMKNVPIDTWSPETQAMLTNNPISETNVFCYTDPVDKSISPNQGVRVYFKDGSRFVLRLSGTGSSGATIRLYLEKVEMDVSKILSPTDQTMQTFCRQAVELCCIEKYTGRQEPSVIT